MTGKKQNFLNLYQILNDHSKFPYPNPFLLFKRLTFNAKHHGIRMLHPYY